MWMTKRAYVPVQAIASFVSLMLPVASASDKPTISQCCQQKKPSSLPATLYPGTCVARGWAASGSWSSLSLTFFFLPSLTPALSALSLCPTDTRQAQELVVGQERAGGRLARGGLCFWAVGLVCTTWKHLWECACRHLHTGKTRAKRGHCQIILATFLSWVWEAMAAGGAAGLADASAQPSLSLHETLGPVATSSKVLSCGSRSFALLCLAAELPSCAFIQGAATDTHQPKLKIHSPSLTLSCLPSLHRCCLHLMLLASPQVTLVLRCAVPAASGFSPIKYFQLKYSSVTHTPLLLTWQRV